MASGDEPAPLAQDLSELHRLSIAVAVPRGRLVPIVTDDNVRSSPRRSDSPEVYSAAGDAELSPTPTVISTVTVLRAADTLSSMGLLTDTQNASIADSISTAQLEAALDLIYVAVDSVAPAKRQSVLHELGLPPKKSRNKLGLHTGTPRRNTVTITSSEPNENKQKEKPREDDDDELRLLDSAGLILERISLEKGLDGQLAGHLDQALQYLKGAQEICRLRATHIERRMQRMISVDANDPADKEVVQWISQAYMDEKDSSTDSVPSTAGKSQKLNKRTISAGTISKRSSEPRGNELTVVLDNARHKSIAPETLNAGPKSDSRQDRAQTAGAASAAAFFRIQQCRAQAQVQEALKLSTEWNFDVFRLEEATAGKPLAVLVTFLLEQSGLIDVLGLSKVKLANFFTEIENGYLKENPFHNNVHASDVTQTMFYFLQSDVMRATLSPQDMLASVMGAAIHDFAHPGTTNGFQIATNSTLALRYNDQSVLENHHISSAFRVLQNPVNNIFEGFDREDVKNMRESIIQMVLATDMQKHVHYVAELEASIKNKKAKRVWFDHSSKEDRHLLMNLGLHTADLSNPCKPRYIYVVWVDRLMKEFYAQGDKERSMDLPISPMCDRHKPAVERSQVGFIDFVIKPLYEQWRDVVGTDIDVCLKHLSANREFYYQSIPRGPPTPKISDNNKKAPSAAVKNKMNRGQTLK